MKIKKLFVGLILLSIWSASMAEIKKVLLTCKVDTAFKRRDETFSTKKETVTVEITQFNDSFFINGEGAMTGIEGTNNVRFPNVSNINDRSTAAKYDVDYVKEVVDPKTGKSVADNISLKIDRVSGQLNFSRTMRTINVDARITTTGLCEKTAGKF